jgi:flagellar hook-associated protein 3 FlgL
MTIEIKSNTPTQALIKIAGIKRAQLQEVSIQIAGGSQHTDFQGYAEDGNVEKLISLKNSLAKSNTYVDSNNLVSGRIDSMSQAVQQIQDIASNLSQLIAQRRNSASGNNIPLDLQASGMLDDIAGKLNIKFDGRYLFSGTKSDTQPVPFIHTSNLTDDNTITASYYQGNSEQPAIQISDSQKIVYGVTGNDIGFQQLIGAVNLAIQGHQEDDDNKLAAAFDLVSNAISNLASARASLGTAKDQITQANSAHNSVNLLVQKNLIDVSQTDIVQATTRMSELQATVEATYLAFQKLSSLKLSNYLN